MINWEDAFKHLAYTAYGLAEGDDNLEQLYEILGMYGLVDDNNEWIYEDEG